MEAGVAILIVAVLLFLAFAVMGVARRNADNLGCLSNLHQVATASLAYAGDRSGRLPFHYKPGGRWSGFGAPLWYTEVAPYLKIEVKNEADGELESPGPFACPADQRPWVGRAGLNPSCSYAPPYDLNVATHGYEMDGEGNRVPVGGWLPLSRVRRPADTVMLSDSLFGNVFAVGLVVNPSNWNSSATSDPDETYRDLPKRHHGLNLVFFDGHAERLPASRLPKSHATRNPPERPTLWGPP